MCIRRPGTAISDGICFYFLLDSHQHKVASGGISLLQARGEENGISENRPGHCLRRHVYWTIGKSASTPRALWTIMPVMPIIAARPLLRSACVEMKRGPLVRLHAQLITRGNFGLLEGTADEAMRATTRDH